MFLQKWHVIFIVLYFQIKKGTSNESEICCCDRYQCERTYLTPEIVEKSTWIILSLFMDGVIGCFILEFSEIFSFRCLALFDS